MAFVSELHTPFALSREHIEFYGCNGYIRLANIFSPELLAYYMNHVSDAVAAAPTSPLDEQLAKDMEDMTYANAFQQTINMWVDNPHARELAFSKRLARIASDLMQVDGVRMYHDQALFKAPGSGHTPWHCDQFYWPLASHKTVTAWIPLLPVPESMGPIEFAAQSHLNDLGRAVGIGTESDRVVGAAVSDGGYRVARGGFDVGEVSFHAGWTFHRASENTSVSDVRKVFTVIYMDKDMKMTEPINDNQRADACRYLKTVEVGGVCKGPLNPVIWEQG